MGENPGRACGCWAGLVAQSHFTFNDIFVLAKTPSILLILGNKPQVFMFSGLMHDFSKCRQQAHGSGDAGRAWMVFHPLSLQDCDDSP